MNNWSAEAWRRVVESSPEGIVVCDATATDCPVVFVNPAFSQMCGYPVAALLGTNLRILQGTDRDQEARVRLAEAVEKGEPARVLVRNYRPDGTLFWNETVVQPVRSAKGQLTHFIGYHRDASERLKTAERAGSGLPSWLREDRLTGLHSRAYFEELLQRDWSLAQRDSHEIGLDAVRHRRPGRLQRQVRPLRRRCLHPPRGARDRRLLPARRRSGRAAGRAARLPCSRRGRRPRRPRSTRRSSPSACAIC